MKYLMILVGFLASSMCGFFTYALYDVLKNIPNVNTNALMCAVIVGVSTFIYCIIKITDNQEVK